MSKMKPSLSTKPEDGPGSSLVPWQGAQRVPPRVPAVLGHPEQEHAGGFQRLCQSPTLISSPSNT